jgi:hypothetical protein
VTPAAREPEAEALVTDRYLEAILAAHGRGADDAPAGLEVDPAVRSAAARLSTTLVRVHPSFRFEERLAARLAEAAARMRLQAAGLEGVIVPVSFGEADTVDRATGPRDLDPDALGRAPLAGALRRGDPVLAPVHAPGQVPRQLLIGGLTSAALSLAGAAYVAWRRGHVPLSPMARAVRAAGEARLAGTRGRIG